MRLVLWDVDGTLVRTGGAGRDVFEVAAEAVLGRPLPDGAFAQVVMSGKTDPQIAREVLRLAEVADPEVDVHLPAVLDRVESALAEAVERIRSEGWVCAGVPDVLSSLAGRADAVIQTVLTGNVAANAAVKLGAFGLERFLDLSIGAYGSDHEDRQRLVGLALAKVRRARGLTVAPADVWVVGDTPLDLAAAQAGGARCLLVATGRYDVDELSGLGADAVLPDLRQTGDVVELLVNR